MYLTAHMTHCLRSKLLKWLLLLTTIINSGYKFLNHFACPAAHIMIYYNFASLMILKLFLWSFSTIKLQQRVLATMWVSLNILLKFNIVPTTT
jgi:hypothetical protein